MIVGEKNIVFLIGDNSIGDNSINMSQIVGSSQIMGSSKDLAFEIQKLQLMLQHKDVVQAHKDEMLKQKDKEIEGLKGMMALMKSQVA